MLGMGGSQLYIPILYWMGLDFKTEAVPLGMLLNVVNSSSAAFIYWRKKLIVWNVAIPFAISMIIFAPLGVWLNVQLPVKPLLVFFALFTAAAAVLMLSGWKPKQGEMSPRGRVILGLTSGSGLGTVAGMIGREGGSFVVPLLYIVGLDAKFAAATSAFVVTCSGVSSFVSHLATAAPPIGELDCNGAVGFSGQPIGLSFDGREDEITCHQASLWLGVIGSRYIDHHQRCDPVMTTSLTKEEFKKSAESHFNGSISK